MLTGPARTRTLRGGTLHAGGLEAAPVCPPRGNRDCFDGRGLQWPDARYRKCMGDKSPKNAHRKAVQKRVKDEAVTREKREITEAQHHPTSGHTATPSHPTTSDERQLQRPRADQSQPDGHPSERE